MYMYVYKSTRLWGFLFMALRRIAGPAQTPSARYEIIFRSSSTWYYIFPSFKYISTLV